MFSREILKLRQPSDWRPAGTFHGNPIAGVRGWVLENSWAIRAVFWEEVTQGWWIGGRTLWHTWGAREFWEQTHKVWEEKTLLEGAE